MWNTFLEVFLKFQTSWLGQFHYGEYYGNHCFSIVWQASTEHYLKNVNDFGLPILKLSETLYCTCQTDFWKHFQNLKQGDSDSCNMDNNLEITVLKLFDKLPLNIP